MASAALRTRLMRTRVRSSTAREVRPGQGMVATESRTAGPAMAVSSGCRWRNSAAMSVTGTGASGTAVAVGRASVWSGSGGDLFKDARGGLDHAVEFGGVMAVGRVQDAGRGEKFAVEH